MARGLSKAGGDPPDKHATALTQLYNSTRAFKRPDGSDYTVLRIRTRLSMSTAFDAIWWWKEEFHGAQGAFANDVANKTSNISTPYCNSHDTENITATDQYLSDPTGFFDEQLLAEFDFGNQLSEDLIGWPSLSINSGFS